MPQWCWPISPSAGCASKIPELTEALTGRFTEHHAFLARVHLDLIDRHTTAIETLTGRIEVMIEPFQGFRQLICTIPGISTLTADLVIAETGADMTRFPTAKHLASCEIYQVPAAAGAACDLSVTCFRVYWSNESRDMHETW